MIRQDARIFFILQKSKLYRFSKIITSREWPKIFVFSSFLIITAVLAVGTYFFSKNTFSYLSFHPQFLATTTLFILLSFFFLIFILTFVSSVISSIGIFFVQDDDSLLLSTPIRHQVIFKSRFLNLLVLSSWPVVVFGAPFLLAFYQQVKFNLLNFILSFGVLIFILVLSALLAAILSLLITSFTGRVGSKILKLLALAALPITAWWVTYVLIPPNFFETFEKTQIGQMNNFLKSLPIYSEFLPSTWAANFVFYWRLSLATSLLNLGKLLASSLVLSILVYWLSNRNYYYDLAKARVGKFVAGAQDITRPAFSKRPFPYLLPGVTGSLLEKDILMFSRNQAEVLQGGFIFFIALLYFLLLGRIPLEKIAQTLPNFSINLLVQINITVISFILTVLALRFVFPAISLEGQSAWLVWSAPFSKAKLFWQKLLTGWGLLSFVAVIASTLSTLILGLNFHFFLAQLSIFLAISLALTSINLGLGTLLPNFGEKNPEKLSTSFGGILATFLSLFYILIVSLILFSSKASLSIFAHLYVWIISAGITVIFSLFSLSKIEKYEF